jgi:hypothetical protein
MHPRCGIPATLPPFEKSLLFIRKCLVEKDLWFAVVIPFLPLVLPVLYSTLVPQHAGQADETGRLPSELH